MYGVPRVHLLTGALLLITTGIAYGNDEVHDFETVHTSNAAILNRLGLAPLQIPDGHHKKRLAGPEPPSLGAQSRIHQPYSRRHGHRDSHVYIVKLPASPPYYTITKPHKSPKDDNKVAKSGSNLPVGFHSNGKPAKIYHWNLPVVKKIGEKKRIQAQMRMEQARKKMEESKKRQQQQQHQQLAPVSGKPDKTIHSTTDVALRTRGAEVKHHYPGIEHRLYPHQKSSVGKHVRNNDKRLSYPTGPEKKVDAIKKVGTNGLANKNYRLDDSSMHRIHLANEVHGPRNTVQKVKKHRKKAAMSYYAPIATKSGSTSIHKNFPGNGKPKAFYVMEKSRKPIYYHPLLP